MGEDIKAVIWDLGGVIVRTEDQTPRLQLAQRLGVTLDELYRFVFTSKTAQKAEIGQIGAEEHWEQVRLYYGLTVEDLIHFQRDFWAGDRVDLKLIDYIRSLRPYYKTALLSNAWSDARGLVRDRFNILDTFDVAIFSAEIGLAKPASEIFQHMLKELCVLPHQAIFIDDLPHNVEGARQTGIYAIRFLNLSQVQEEINRLTNHL
jgi:epoxide hydrolase-like predicted phosphatase